MAVFCRDGQLIMEAHVYESECLSLANAVSCASCNIIDVLTFVHDDKASPLLSFFSFKICFMVEHLYFDVNGSVVQKSGLTL